MSKRHINLIYYPTLFCLLVLCVMAWIDVPYYTEKEAVNTYWSIFAYVILFYGFYLVAKNFLEDYDYAVSFVGVLVSSIPGFVVIYLAMNFLNDAPWNAVFLQDQISWVVFVLLINYIILYFMESKLTLNGFATLLCIVLLLGCGVLTVLVFDLPMGLLWVKLSFTLSIISIWLKFMAEHRDIDKRAERMKRYW